MLDPRPSNGKVYEVYGAAEWAARREPSAGRTHATGREEARGQLDRLDWRALPTPAGCSQLSPPTPWVTAFGINETEEVIKTAKAVIDRARYHYCGDCGRGYDDRVWGEQHYYDRRASRQ